MKRILFNDDWYCNGKKVTLPYDAMLFNGRSPDSVGGSAVGYFKDGSYIFEKSFVAPKDECTIFEFEGVYKNAKVYINDKEAGGAAYGYIPFFIEASPYLKEGENKIRVECFVKHPDSRWYSGAGIFRPVYLWSGPKEGIRPESVKITTLSINPAIIKIESPISVKVDVDGIIGEGNNFDLTIPNARLWDENNPYLYVAKISTKDDYDEIKFGIRKIEWSANKGLLINGKNTLLKGGCMHHDNGILGAVTYYESEYRRVKKLKDAGFNAIRSAHNPCSKYLLEACDKLGMYIMDETWDMWYYHKNKYDYSIDWKENYLSDLNALVSRDYNHPSVIMYSIGNEVSEPYKKEGVDITKQLCDYLHSLDQTRPVTGGFNLTIMYQAAKGNAVYKQDGSDGLEDNKKKQSSMNSTMFNMMASLVGTGMNKAANSKDADKITSPSLDALDIAGYNYASGRYPLEGNAHPNRIVVGSETFPQDIAKNWEMVKKYPYLIGDFMWTAWDYLGETGIGAWTYEKDGKVFAKPYPWILADTGAFDILGNPNGELFLASAVWGKLSKPAICLSPLGRKTKLIKSTWRGSNSLPSYAWTNCNGERADVEVYSDAYSIELLVNGKSVGRKYIKDYKATFKIKYVPGVLTAIAYGNDGYEISRNELMSAEAPLKVGIYPEKETIKENEIVYVPIVIEGSNGVVESNADRKLNIDVKGGELLAFGSANPRTEEVYYSGSFTTYYGHALAIIKANKKGSIEINVTSNLETSNKVLKVI